MNDEVPKGATRGACRSCGRQILWVTMAATGKANPLDREPVEGGNVATNSEGGWVVLTRAEVEARTAAGTKGYMSHFATCPNAAQHRKKK